MGFTEILTIVFIVLKLTGFIDWAWWLVLLPEIIAVAFYILIWVINAVIISKTRSDIKKLHRDMFKHF